MSGVPTAAEVLLRTTEFGECLLWGGHMANGSPQAYGAGRYHQIRRIVYVEAKGPIPADKRPVMKCREPGCLNVEHMKLMTLKQIGALAASEGKFSSPQRRAAVALGKRKAPSAKLDADKVADIVAARTGKEAAAKHGIHKSMACRIRAGQAWAEIGGASAFTFRP